MSNKYNVHPITYREGIKGKLKYSSTLSITSALDGWECVVNATPRRALPLGMTRYSLYRRLGGPEGVSGGVRYTPFGISDGQGFPVPVYNFNSAPYLQAGTHSLTIDTVFDIVDVAK
jgi:hypothetical protein